jgi:hypothetical protein
VSIWGTKLESRRTALFFTEMPVRPFAKDDIPQVTDLYWKVLRQRKGPLPAEIRSCIHELYFENPWIESSIPSLVFDEKGKIAGFLGVVPRRMSLGGLSFFTAVGGNFVVHPDSRNSLAGLYTFCAPTCREDRTCR